MSNDSSLSKIFTAILYYEAEIKTIKKKLDYNEKKLAQRILKCGPGPIRSQSFDQDKGSSTTVFQTDLERLDEIGLLTVAIGILKSDLAEAEKNYAFQKGLVAGLRLDLQTRKETDIRVVVFEEKFVNHKSHEEIAKDLGYSVGHIFNTMVEINGLLGLNGD